MLIVLKKRIMGLIVKENKHLPFTSYFSLLNFDFSFQFWLVETIKLLQKLFSISKMHLSSVSKLNPGKRINPESRTNQCFFVFLSEIKKEQFAHTVNSSGKVKFFSKPISFFDWHSNWFILYLIMEPKQMKIPLKRFIVNKSGILSIVSPSKGRCVQQENHFIGVSVHSSVVSNAEIVE